MAASGNSILGETLREIRLAKGLTLKDASFLSGIPSTVIVALETSDFSLPGTTHLQASTVYRKGFYRTYSRALGLSEEEIAASEATDSESDLKIAPKKPAKPVITPRLQPEPGARVTAKAAPEPRAIVVAPSRHKRDTASDGVPRMPMVVVFVALLAGAGYLVRLVEINRKQPPPSSSTSPAMLVPVALPSRTSATVAVPPAKSEPLVTWSPAKTEPPRTQPPVFVPPEPDPLETTSLEFVEIRAAIPVDPSELEAEVAPE
jgi:cytoskeletal protein RodZ